MATYRIEAPHFYEIVYIEGDHTMNIEIDLRDPVPCIYRKAVVAWNAPHEGETVSDTKRDEIVDRIFGYLTNVKKYRQVEIERS